MFQQRKGPPEGKKSVSATGQMFRVRNPRKGPPEGKSLRNVSKKSTIGGG